MNYKLSILLFFLFFVFIQCKQNNELSEEQQKEWVLKNSNWVLNDWVADSISILTLSEKPITLDIDLDNEKISGNAGCNQYFGNYTLDNETLKAGPMGSTMMYCTEEIMKQEQRFLALFEAGIKISKNNDLLILRSDNNQLTFKPIQK